MKNIILLNPPAREKIQRDYYCSHTVKADYLWQPYDLFVLSGQLSSHNLKLVDCIKDNIDIEKCTRLIIDFKADYIISQIAAADFKNDIKTLKTIHDKTSIPVILTGDIVKPHPLEFLDEFNFIEAVITNIFYNSISDFLENRKNNLINIAYKNFYNEKLPQNYFKIPAGDFSQFLSEKYTLPHISTGLMHTTSASFGCPAHCSYCHFEKIPAVLRDPSNLEQELEKAFKAGVKTIHFRDQTFGYNKKHLKEIISILSKFNFKFIIYTRADTLNLKELRLLKKAGLECVETGIENADYKIRKKFGKNISDKTIIDFFRNCNKLHIKTLAIFIAGLGLDNKLSIRKTLFLLKEIKPDYISVNSFIRKTGTSFETENPYNENQDPSKHNHKTSEFKRKIYIAHYFSIRIISKELYNAFKNKKIKNLFKNFAGFIKNII